MGKISYIMCYVSYRAQGGCTFTRKMLVLLSHRIRIKVQCRTEAITTPIDIREIDISIFYQQNAENLFWDSNGHIYSSITVWSNPISTIQRGLQDGLRACNNSQLTCDHHHCASYSRRVKDPWTYSEAVMAECHLSIPDPFRRVWILPGCLNWWKLSFIRASCIFHIQHSSQQRAKWLKWKWCWTTRIDNLTALLKIGSHTNISDNGITTLN